MHTVFALLCFVVVIHWLIFPYPSGLLHWHCGNLTIAPVPAKQPWWIWINTSCEFIMNDCITTTKQSTTKSCAYFLGYTVVEILPDRRRDVWILHCQQHDCRYHRGLSSYDTEIVLPKQTCFNTKWINIIWLAPWSKYKSVAYLWIFWNQIDILRENCEIFSVKQW